MSFTLDQISAGKNVEVTAISRSIPGLFKRLQSLGLVTGTKVKVLRFAPFKGPIAIQTRGFTLSLRRNEAQTITVAEQ